VSSLVPLALWLQTSPGALLPQLRQALLNVLRNAREAALERPRGPGDRRARIEVSVTVEPLPRSQ